MTRCIGSTDRAHGHAAKNVKDCKLRIGQNAKVEDRLPQRPASAGFLFAARMLHDDARQSAVGREPRFTMCALSGRWANRARAGNGGLQAKSRIHTIGHDQPFKPHPNITPNRAFADGRAKHALHWEGAVLPPCMPGEASLRRSIPSARVLSPDFLSSTG